MTLRIAALLLSAAALGCETLPGPGGGGLEPAGWIDRLGLWTWTHPNGLVWVIATTYSGAAVAAGVQPSDYIHSVDGQAVRSAADIQKAIQGRKAGERVGLLLRRWDGEVRVIVPLDRDGAKPLFGAQLAPATPPAAGLRVVALTPGSPAAAAGVEPGDHLRRLDGDDVSTLADLFGALSRRAPGERIPVELERAGQPRTLEVVLGERPAPQQLRLPGWEGSYDISGLWKPTGAHRFGFKPGQGQWMKTVWLPSDDPEAGPRPWLNYFVPATLAAGLMAPEWYGPGPMVEGGVVIQPATFARAIFGVREVALGAARYYAMTDVVYRTHLYAPGAADSVEEESRRDLMLALYASEPRPGAAPERVLLLGTRKYTLGNDPWVWTPQETAVVYAGQKLWQASAEMRGNEIVRLEFKERVASAAEAFALRPFRQMPFDDFTKYLIAWKANELDRLLRDARTDVLKEHAVRIEQTILEADELSERAKDEAQRAVERNQGDVERFTQRARLYRSRIEVLRPILAAIKDELANRAR